MMEFQYAWYVGENKYDFDMQPSEWNMATRVVVLSTCQFAPVDAPIAKMI